MNWRRSLSERSAAEWAIRVAIAVAISWIGYLMVEISIAQALPDAQLVRASRLAPHNGRILAALSEQLSGPDATAARRQRANQLARLALERDPTQPAAAATLAIQQLLAGDMPGFRRWLEYSERLSRRNLRTQLLAIEDATMRSDIPAALEHYDIVLRTKRNGPDLLYPVLAKASSDPQIRPELVKRLAANPIWAASFIDYLAANGSDPGDVAVLFAALQKQRVVVAEGARAHVVNRMVEKGQFSQAWNYYGSFRRDASQRASRDPRFVIAPDNATVFDWMATSDASISASVQRGAAGGVFDFSMPAGVGGVVLQQLQMLPPGDYILRGHSSGIDQPVASRPYWTLSCRGGAELGRVAVGNSADADGRFGGRFSVPANCPVQVLAMVTQASDAIGGVSGQIDQVTLHEVR